MRGWVVLHDQFRVHDYNVPSSWNSAITEKLRCVTTLGTEKMKPGAVSMSKLEQDNVFLHLGNIY